MCTLGDAADVNQVPATRVATHVAGTWRDSLPIDMLLSAMSVLVVARPSSEIPEGLMNNPVYSGFHDSKALDSFISPN